jgi:hypothetical protein
MCPPSEVSIDDACATVMKPVEGGESTTMSFPKPPKFSDKLAERQFLKERLAAAFRIFAKYGFDEGVGLFSSLYYSLLLKTDMDKPVISLSATPLIYQHFGSTPLELISP